MAGSPCCQAQPSAGRSAGRLRLSLHHHPAGQPASPGLDGAAGATPCASSSAALGDALPCARANLFCVPAQQSSAPQRLLARRRGRHRTGAPEAGAAQPPWSSPPCQAAYSLPAGGSRSEAAPRHGAGGRPAPSSGGSSCSSGGRPWRCWCCCTHCSSTCGGPARMASASCPRLRVLHPSESTRGTLASSRTSCQTARLDWPLSEPCSRASGQPSQLGAGAGCDGQMRPSSKPAGSRMALLVCHTLRSGYSLHQHSKRQQQRRTLALFATSAPEVRAAAPARRLSRQGAQPGARRPARPGQARRRAPLAGR